MFGSDPSFDAPPQVASAPITGNGALGMSPNFWNNLAMFGAALSAGANQRTSDGHLANGTGFGGALGAGTLDYMQLQRQNAAARAQQGVAQQQARALGLSNDITQMSMPIIKEGNQQALDYMRGAQVPGAQNQQPFGPGDETSVQRNIGNVESGSNPSAVNSQGYAGRYQLGTAALASAGVYKPADGEDLTKNEWKGTINLPGFQPMTMQQFAANPQAQKLAWNAHQANLDTEIKGRGLDSYVGQSVGGVPVTHDSLTAMMQIGGPAGTERFLKSGGLYDPADSNGTRISDYALKVTGGQPQGRGQQYAGPGVPQPQQGAPQQAAPSIQPDQGLMTKANQYRQMAIAYGRVPALSGMATQYGQMAQDYFKMAYAGPQAAAVAAAQTPSALAQKGFRQNPDGTQSPIPGSEASLEYQRSLQETKPVDIRTGGMVRLPSGQWVKNPEHVQVQRPDGSFGMDYISPPLPGSAPGTAGESSPVLGSSNQPVTTKISPTQEEFLKTRGENLAHQFDKIDSDASAAIQSNYLFDNLRREGQGFQMGRFAEWEGEGRAWLSAMAHTFGVNAEGLDKPLADYTAFLKGSGSLLRTAVHETSSRAAAQEYTMIGQTLPTPNTPEAGFNQVADQWQALSDYSIAKQKFAQGYKGKPEEFNVSFNSQVAPSSFLLNRMSQTPEGQRNMQEMVANLSKTPQGRLQLGRIQAEYNQTKKLGLFEGIDYSKAPAPAAPAAPANDLLVTPPGGG